MITFTESVLLHPRLSVRVTEYIPEEFAVIADVVSPVFQRVFEYGLLVSIAPVSLHTVREAGNPLDGSA